MLVEVQFPQAVAQGGESMDDRSHHRPVFPAEGHFEAGVQDIVVPVPIPVPLPTPRGIRTEQPREQDQTAEEQAGEEQTMEGIHGG